MNHEPVTPVKPVAPYVGGKFLLAKVICPVIGHHQHLTYAEPFVGMGGVFLRRRQRPKFEVINDINRDIWNLFRILREHGPALSAYLHHQLTSRAEYDRLARIDPDTLTDLQRAARFLYLQRNAFGGKVSVRSFGCSPQRLSRFDLSRVLPLLEAVSRRLHGVTLECLPYADFITRYDRPQTLFYLDPPYWGCENDYGKGIFAREDYASLADLLASISGDFLMSLNDTPQVRQTFDAFHIAEVSTFYSVNRGRMEPARELLISSFHPNLPEKTQR